MDAIQVVKKKKKKKIKKGKKTKERKKWHVEFSLIWYLGQL